MNNFEDFIKEHSTLNVAPTQKELNALKELNSKKFFNFKILFSSLATASVFLIALFVLKPNVSNTTSVSDLSVEDYMTEVFFAVEEESFDSDLDEFFL